MKRTRIFFTRKHLISLILALSIVFGIVAIAGAAEHPFTDVPDSVWYSQFVDYVYDHNLMSGTSDSTFSPDIRMTRAMAVTVLYSIAGKPEVTAENPFADVPAGKWYESAVLWAMTEGITGGTSSTTFSPNSHVTREQLVTFLFRYAQTLGTEMVSTGLEQYADRDGVSVWAEGPFRWAVGTGIISGTDETHLSPKSTATRAECATILTQFDRWIRALPEETQPTEPSTEPTEAPEQSDEDYFGQSFLPELRFVVSSDVHVDDSGSQVQEQRLADLFTASYAYAETQVYNKVDGAFFAGDFTNYGTQSSMDKFFRIIRENIHPETVSRVTLGNHEYYTDGENTVSRFLQASGYEEANCHLVLNGYHFLFVNPDLNGLHFSEDTQNWLATELQIAAQDDPDGTRPIFVFQHEHIQHTVYGSLDWGMTDLTDILEQYPQVIDFSGHSHYPISDPRSIWQDSFTALGTGSLSYYEMDLVGVQTYSIFHTDYEGGYRTHAALFDAAQYYIVEVDANHAVRILAYDLNVDRFLEEPLLLRSVGNPQSFRYTPSRQEASEAPYFPEDTQVSLTALTDSFAKITFTQASCRDYVQHYRVELYREDQLISSQYRLSCWFYLPTPTELTATFSELEPGTEYTVKITAVSAWEKESEPYQFSFRTTGK